MALIKRAGSSVIENQVAKKIYVKQLEQEQYIKPQAQEQYSEIRIRKIGNYKCVATKSQGIYKITEGKSGYIAVVDYGSVEVLDKKTGKFVKKRKKSTRRFETFDEAFAFRTNINANKTYGFKKGMTLEGAINDYKKSTRYIDRISGSQQQHYDNYFRHVIAALGEIEPRDISVARMEEYFKYLLENGSREKKKGHEEETKGLSINSIGKHKSCLKALWEFMIADPKYGITQNIPALSQIPWVEITDEEGRTVKVHKIEPEFEVLTLEQTNYSLAKERVSTSEEKTKPAVDKKAPNKEAPNISNKSVTLKTYRMQF